MFVFTVCLSYLTFHPITVYSIMETPLGYTDKHRNALLDRWLYRKEDGTYGISRHGTVFALK